MKSVPPQNNVSCIPHFVEWMYMAFALQLNKNYTQWTTVRLGPPDIKVGEELLLLQAQN
jgi:hypothetical protein